MNTVHLEETMKLRTLILTAGSIFAFAGCVDTVKDDSGTTTEADTDTDTDADTDTDTDADTFTVSGDFAIGTADFKSLIGLWSLSGTSTSCTDCLYAFDGTFTFVKGAGEDFTRAVTIADQGSTYKGYNVGLVYADSDMWGYGFDDPAKGYTIVTNYPMYKNGDSIPYGYIGYWYR